MHCSKCESTNLIKWGRTACGYQRYRCQDCKATVADVPQSPIAPMRLSMDRAVLVLSLLVEGMSIRGAERITGHHRDTIGRLALLAGRKCERLLETLIHGAKVDDVEVDELWSFIQMKQGTKTRREIGNAEYGDCYTYLAQERNSKLILTHHTEPRSWNDTEVFIAKLAKATEGTYQLTSDGWDGYPYAIQQHLGHRVDYAQLIKKYGQDAEAQRRYSPPRITGVDKKYFGRYPNPDRICTSHVERLNLDVRMKCRRFTRLSNGFSRKLENHRAAVALTVAHFNLVKMHSSIRMTPAMKAGITNRIWGVQDLLAA